MLSELAELFACVMHQSTDQHKTYTFKQMRNISLQLFLLYSVPCDNAFKSIWFFFCFLATHLPSPSTYFAPSVNKPLIPTCPSGYQPRWVFLFLIIACLNLQPGKLGQWIMMIIKTYIGLFRNRKNSNCDEETISTISLLVLHQNFVFLFFLLHYGKTTEGSW